MKIVLIRHGATKGNLEKRYIGRTDEDLCGEGIKKLKEDTCAGIYPPAQAVFSSPMKRCLSTAECIYPVQTPQIVWDFRECDFGLFEGKNYKELADTIVKNLSGPDYKAKVGENGNFILMHSVGSIPHGAEIDVPLNYADYYYEEALIRKRNIENNQPFSFVNE